ncbi:unnamed protein product [Rotaria sordida]|uniref:Uncharacterized protein n=1 Tax=Rotaria sordida TaxID=392033 RepID=A0A818P9Q0_9BILA|nr:unnamed protein product [Rotaria sordida]CAF0806531.1 unnamed protein product [Rotaria sordida]CAF0845900.1 unnamed protein product [Rotaria sordida]CAF0868093.1 unnamed protein product [Rotaria sordida]CAF3617312.1 unnamed protein product [Rotaria sordida]
MSNSRQKSEDKVRHIHSPLKKSSHELVTAPPLSQIPYLNGVFDDETTNDQPKIIYVRETDSDYIRRCKLGGSSDLLVYIDPATCKSKEPVPYPRPLWWDAMCEQIPSSPNSDNDQQQEKKSSKSEHGFGAPDWFAHDERNRSPNKQQNKTSRKSQLSTYTKRK